MVEKEYLRLRNNGVDVELTPLQKEMLRYLMSLEHKRKIYIIKKRTICL